MTLFIICAVVSLVGIILTLFQAGTVWAAVKRDRKPATGGPGPDAGHYPSISILKPLRGLDDNLFDNLASFCTQDYPDYEVLFSLQDHNDPAYKVAKMVQDKYPASNITIVVERCSAGLNPKVNNLIPAYRKSRHPYILISDSNVLVGRDYLAEIVRHTQDPSVGLVSNLIRGVGGRSIGAKLENLHLKSFIIGSVSLLDRFLGMPCVIGKSMLMKKDDLRALGGLEAFKDILAEDFIIGREMQRSGKRVVLSKYLISNVNEYWDVKRFLNRHTRWGKLRWRIGGAKYLSELLVNPVFIAALPVIASGPSRLTVGFAGLISLIKILADSIIGRRIEAQGSDYPSAIRSSFTCLLVPFKDILIGGLWIVPILSATVVWRGNRYLIGSDSRLAPCPDTGVWSWGYRITDVIRERFA